MRLLVRNMPSLTLLLTLLLSLLTSCHALGEVVDVELDLLLCHAAAGSCNRKDSKFLQWPMVRQQSTAERYSVCSRQQQAATTSASREGRAEQAR